MCGCVCEKERVRERERERERKEKCHLTTDRQKASIENPALNSKAAATEAQKLEEQALMKFLLFKAKILWQLTEMESLSNGCC